MFECFLACAYAILTRMMWAQMPRRVAGKSEHVDAVKATSHRVSQSGYTIVEALIFLAVSAAIGVGAMAMVAGQQRKTEFNDSVRDIESSIQDVINDSATGFSSLDIDTSSRSCRLNPPTYNSASLYPLPLTAAQKTFPRCIYLGRVLQFTTTSTYRVYPVLGKQKDSAGKEVQDLAAAQPILYNPQAKKIRNGLVVGRIECGSCGVGATVGSVGFLTTFQQYSGGSLTSGSNTTSLIPVKNSSLGDTQAAVSALVHPTLTPYDANLNVVNPDSGVKVCLSDTGGNQYAVIKVGGSNGKLGTAVSYYRGSSTCPTPLP